MAFRYSADETGLNKVSLISGTSYLYLEYILGEHISDKSHPVIGVGIGSRILSEEYFNVHLGGEALAVVEQGDLDDDSTWDDVQMLSVAKAQIGYKPFKEYFEIFFRVFNR